MDFEEDQPWWRSLVHGLGVLLGLIVLSALLMGGILLVARHFDRPAEVPPVQIVTITEPPKVQDNARTRVTPPYGPFSLPNSPGRPAGFGARETHLARGAPPPPPRTDQPPRPPEVPVGVSVEEYRAIVDTGQKPYLPDPKGECDLSGQSAAQSASGLENCFAQRAARR